MTERSPLDAFKDVLSGTARSIARDMEVEVGFTADAPHLAGKAIKVPTPRALCPPIRWRWRGALPTPMR